MPSVAASTSCWPRRWTGSAATRSTPPASGKSLAFADVKLVTLSEGEITELHVGLKGAMNALFLKDLAAKTHRGLAGRVEAGKSGGGLSYGYRITRQLDARGDRMIDADQAPVVQRIFTLFAAGSSPIAIAKILNRESIPGPGGKAWQDTTIRGHAGRGTGILRNELYIGRLVWNRMRLIRDPVSGKRVSRMNPPGDWVMRDVPELRIIDQETWQQVQGRLGAIRDASGANDPQRPDFWTRRRPQHILTGKLFCGRCGGVFGNSGRDYLACDAAKKQAVCDNHRSIRRQVLEDIVLEALRTRLMEPSLVALFISEFTAEWNRLQAEFGAGRAQQERELAQIERKLSGLIDAIAPRLHSNLANLYRDRVASLQVALRHETDGQEALEVVRGLIERITLTPAAEGDGLEVDVTGRDRRDARPRHGRCYRRKKAGPNGPAFLLRSRVR